MLSQKISNLEKSFVPWGRLPLACYPAVVQKPFQFPTFQSSPFRPYACLSTD